MDISDPQTNMVIIVFIGGLLGNVILNAIKWWQTKGQFEQNGITIKFDSKAIITAVTALIPVVIGTSAIFNSILNAVNASNPVSYAAAFLFALGATLGLNYGINKQVPFNVIQKNDLNLKIIEEHAKLHKFNQSLKEENKEDVQT